MYLLTLSDLNQTIHTSPLQEPPLVPSYLQERLQQLVKQILTHIPHPQLAHTRIEGVKVNHPRQE
ncbi:hypothetical protein QUA80_32875, partial [Microcoleus sp. F4-D5]